MRLALAAALAFAVVTPAAAQDGQTLFNTQCKTCHSVTGPSTPAGPTLKGVAGRKVASAPGYSYSAGLTKKGGTWTDANLDAFLAGPSAYAPGSKMFTKVATPQARAALIAWLKTKK